MKEIRMKLPSIFVIGDSISIQYGPHLEAMVSGKFSYARRTGVEEALKNLDVATGANGGNSARVLEYLKVIISDKDFHPDWLLINCGLHDIKTNRETGAKEVALVDYKKNLSEIVHLVNEKSIRLIFIRTTPVEEDLHNSYSSKGFLRFAKDVTDYNAAADKIMADAGVPTIDLFGLTRNLGGPELCTDHVHYHDNICQLQAAYIAGYLDARSVLIGKG
jgi:lysophospholipase L1-like esterase